MKRFAIVALSFLATCSLFASDEPVGFEDPNVINQVMAGKVVMTPVVDTKLELIQIARAYFDKVSPEAYADLAVDFKKYPVMFSEIESGKQLTVNQDKTEYTYELDMPVKIGFITQHVRPRGKLNLMMADDAVSESELTNQITNYEDQIETALQTTRLIPYQGGILVEDTIHAKLKQSPYSGTMKTRLKEFYSKFLPVMRKQLE